MAGPQDLVVSVSFPFGRYAATPWYRSRREHVGNVEWPPSPWRIVRALVCSAHRLGDDGLVEEAVALVRRLACVEPRYLLPPAREVVYAQWMPQLEYDDAPGATQRSENGHTLLAIDPDRELLVRWPGLALDESERHLLARLLEATPFLGQSVAVSYLRLRESWPALRWDEGEAVPRAAEGELAGQGGDRVVVRLLAPEPTVTRADLEVSTADGLVKAMPAPPGARWVEYVRRTPPRRRPRKLDPLVSTIVHRLEGALRPAVAGPSHPEAGRPGPRGLPPLAELLRRACGYLPSCVEVIPADDDLDGRAERLVIRLADPIPISRASTLLAPRERLLGPSIDCALRLERVHWATDATDAPGEGSSDVIRERLIVFRVESLRPPPLTEALSVCEIYRRRMLGVAGRRLGADAIPPLLSGKRYAGDPVEDDHRHAHVLVSSRDGRTIDTLAVWCPAGLGPEETAIVRATTLPPLLGAPVALVETDEDPFSGPARRFCSHTPFLPVRHPKRRGDRLRDAVEEQVATELVRRGLPSPARVSRLPGPWETFRIVRLAKKGCFPELGAHGFDIDLPEPVQGPIAIGRNSHFGMGLFLPTT